MKKTIKYRFGAIACFFFILMVCVGCDNGSQISGSGSSSQPTASQPSQSQPAQTAADTDNTDTSVSDNKNTVNWPYNLKGDNRVSVPEGVFTDSDKILARNFIIVYDDSGSMSGQKIRDARKAFREFVTNLLPNGSNLGLISLNNGKIELKTTNPDVKNEFANTVDKIDDGGGTPLSGAVADAFFMLTSQSFLQSGCGDYTILVITDGEANNTRSLENNINYIVDNSPVKIYTIGFQIGEDHTLNQPGRTTYKTADTLEELIEGMKEGLAETESFDDVTFD